MLSGLLLLTTIAVIFVNGWTDAPNAIATAVSTGAMSYRRAVQLAAVCNLLGIVGMTLISTSVVDTMTSLASFGSGTQQQAMAALCAAMLSIVLFAVVAWWFGIPTSESHALIAALTGAALALGGAGSVDKSAWGLVLWGLLLSLALGLGLGWLLTRFFQTPLQRLSRQTLDHFQIAAAGGMAFMHGAQDGQKFIAVLVTVNMLTRGGYAQGAVELREHWLAVLLCAVVMALGTSLGGRRIIETVGVQMTSVSKERGVCADIAGSICLLIASLLGIPMSTTHTKTTAILGAGLAGARGTTNFGIVGGLALTWLITFPVCGLLGYGLTRLFFLFL